MKGKFLNLTSVILSIIAISLMWCTFFSIGQEVNPSYRQGYTSHDIEDARQKLREDAKKNTEEKEKEIKECIDRNIKKIKAMKNLYESLEYAFTYTDTGLEYSLVSQKEGEKTHYISTDDNSIKLSTNDYFIRIYFKNDSYNYIKSYIPDNVNLESEIVMFENIIYEEVDRIKQLVATKNNATGRK